MMGFEQLLNTDYQDIICKTVGTDQGPQVHGLTETGEEMGSMCLTSTT